MHLLVCICLSGRCLLVFIQDASALSPVVLLTSTRARATTYDTSDGGRDIPINSNQPSAPSPSLSFLPENPPNRIFLFAQHSASPRYCDSIYRIDTLLFSPRDYLASSPLDSRSNHPSTRATPTTPTKLANYLPTLQFTVLHHYTYKPTAASRFQQWRITRSWSGTKVCFFSPSALFWQNAVFFTVASFLLRVLFLGAGNV